MHIVQVLCMPFQFLNGAIGVDLAVSEGIIYGRFQFLNGAIGVQERAYHTGVFIDISIP